MNFTKGQYVYVTKNGGLMGAGQITDVTGNGEFYAVRMAGTGYIVPATAAELELHPQQDSGWGKPAPRTERFRLWVCLCCMLSHANGECCPDDTHGGDSIAPWTLLSDGEHVTMGGGEHSEYCTRDTDGDCDCDINTYSTSQCDGCGSWLHGERHAFTLWRPVGVSLVKAS